MIKTLSLCLSLFSSLAFSEVFLKMDDASKKIYNKPASYEYAPSVHFNSGANWVAYYCGTTPSGDGVYRLATNNGGSTWSADALVLEADGSFGEGTHACDPSVVRNGSIYNLFYTSESGSGGTKNKIYRATSVDGINWSKNGVVVDMINPSTTGYGAGQPSVLLDSKRNTWTMYYTDTSLGGNTLYRVDSAGLGTWPSSTRQQVTLHNMASVVSIDVAYHPATQGYIGVVTSLGDAIYRGWVQVVWSDDGLNFHKIGEMPSTTHVNHNPAILRNIVGHTGSSTRVFWGGGTGGANNSGAPTWDLYMSDKVYW